MTRDDTDRDLTSTQASTEATIPFQRGDTVRAQPVKFGGAHAQEWVYGRLDVVDPTEDPWAAEMVWVDDQPVLVDSSTLEHVPPHIPEQGTRS